MATLTVIDEATAPKKPSAGTGANRRRQAEYDAYLKVVTTGKVGRLQPSSTETTRALAARIARAASRAGKSVESWAVDGVLYFKVV